MSNCATFNACGTPTTGGADSPIYSTVIEITFNTIFASGSTYTFTHDDGIVLQKEGGAILLDARTPTAAEASVCDLCVGQSGTFELFYIATNGNPEVLTATTASVPDGGATLMLLGAALAGVETLRRRLRA